MVSPSHTLYVQTDAIYHYEEDQLTRQSVTSVAADNALRRREILAGILPPALRWINSDGTAFLVERPPMEVAAQFYNGDPNVRYITLETGEAYTFRVQLPWTVFLFRFATTRTSQLSSIQMWCRPSAIRSPSDQLFYFPWPGVDGTEIVLQGKLAPYSLADYVGSGRASTSGAILSYLLSSFWETQFVNNVALMTERLPTALRETVGMAYTFRDVLSFYAERNQDEMLDQEWVPHTTVEEMMEEDNAAKWKSAAAFIAGLGVAYK